MRSRPVRGVLSAAALALFSATAPALAGLASVTGTVRLADPVRPPLSVFKRDEVCRGGVANERLYAVGGYGPAEVAQHVGPTLRRPT